VNSSPKVVWGFTPLAITSLTIGFEYPGETGVQLQLRTRTQPFLEGAASVSCRDKNLSAHHFPLDVTISRPNRFSPPMEAVTTVFAGL